MHQPSLTPGDGDMLPVIFDATKKSRCQPRQTLAYLLALANHHVTRNLAYQCQTVNDFKSSTCLSHSGRGCLQLERRPPSFSFGPIAPNAIRVRGTLTVYGSSSQAP
eukprot:scaffold29066_cov19-Prasinocladus_malaysianus.AAC.1